MTKVKFLKAGAAFGYGCFAGDEAEIKSQEKLQNLLDKGVVQVLEKKALTDAEKKAAKQAAAASKADNEATKQAAAASKADNEATKQAAAAAKNPEGPESPNGADPEDLDAQAEAEKQ